MSNVLHSIEKTLIAELQNLSSSTAEDLARRTGLSTDQVRRGMEWLRLKDLATIEETSVTAVSLGANGLGALENGLPERRLLDMAGGGSATMRDLRDALQSDFGPAMGAARRNGWIKMMDAAADGDNAGIISVVSNPGRLPEERVLESIGTGVIPLADIRDQKSYDLLKRRPDFVVERTTKSRVIRLGRAAKDLDVGRAGTGGDGAGRSGTAAEIDVEAAVPTAYAARRHPLKETIDEIREIFVTLGFSEIYGNLAQPCFWNFDALFTPQDHPAREMQDTFYLDGGMRARGARRQHGSSWTPSQAKSVAAAHRGAWRHRWDPKEAERMVLRTHTTCVTIRHLAQTLPQKEARLFSLGRVFRNEKVSYKHLVEFNQVEGVVADKNASLRDLMGIQKEFYRRIGLTRVKFWPTFFPYTEPSLQTMVYNDRLGKWVELFGMGIFRPEVTRPLGIDIPVLAWGGGIERIAMLKYGIDDVREFYANDLGWLRTVPRCR